MFLCVGEHVCVWLSVSVLLLVAVLFYVLGYSYMRSCACTHILTSFTHSKGGTSGWKGVRDRER